MRLLTKCYKQPKDMFGFPVDRKFAGAYQEFLSIHLTLSLKQYPQYLQKLFYTVIKQLLYPEKK